MKIILIIPLLMFYSLCLCQNDMVEVEDRFLNAKLREYLLTHLDDFTRDSLNNKIPINDSYAHLIYDNVDILSCNLKTDSSTLLNSIGFYRFTFACLSGCSPHIYIQHPNKIEFVNIDDEDFDIDDFLKKMMRFFKENSGKFTLEEKVKTIEGVMETIIDNRFEYYSW